MKKSRSGFYTKTGTRFLGEQTGDIEDEFKGLVSTVFRDQHRLIRAYLARVQHCNEIEYCVALCLSYEGDNREEMVHDLADIFRRMFGSREHLDILFLSKSQEEDLRKVCCPFFSTMRPDTPDFYMTSSEGYGLEPVRACFKVRRLFNGHPDGYMLCEIDPPILGQPYGLGGQELRQVVLASRHSGYSLFENVNWPVYVHVARLTRQISDKFVIAEDDVDSIGWAEIYKSSIAAKSSRGLISPRDSTTT